jgi:myo-inositol-1(or 4)-monophosphatase
MDDETSRRVTAGCAAVRARTAHLHEHFGLAETRWKHDGTRVTPADLAISRDLFADLAAQFPADQFFSEETEPGGAPVPLRARFSWVLDPIDGTNNYALGIPVCAISLALLDGGMPVCGFVYDLGLRTLFHGGGELPVWADATEILPTVPESGTQKVVVMHSPVGDANLPLVLRVLREYKLRAFGSGALHLVYAAIGRVDAAIDLTVRVWDIAAAWAFCQRLGVEVWFFDAPVFPLRAFDLHMAPVRYLAGRADVCARLLPQLEEAGLRRRR